MSNKVFSIEDMEEEFIKGANSMISFLREEGIICRRKDNCGECNKVYGFLDKKVKGRKGLQNKDPHNLDLGLPTDKQNN